MELKKLLESPIMDTPKNGQPLTMLIPSMSVIQRFHCTTILGVSTVYTELNTILFVYYHDVVGLHSSAEPSV